jgi:hypothetical protein
MAGRVGKDPEARLALTRDADGTEGDQVALGLIGIIHTGVQVHLLGVVGVRPARRDPGKSHAGTPDHPKD